MNIVLIICVGLSIICVIFLSIICVILYRKSRDKYISIKTPKLVAQEIVTTNNIFMVWVGKYPKINYMTQIKNAINSFKYHNPNHNLYLFSNIIPANEVNCAVLPINLDKGIYKNTPVENINFEPEGEHFGKKTPIKPALWSDMFRCIMLWKYGGSYIDVDDICIRPIPTKIFNILPSSALENKTEMKEYNGGISSNHFNYKWRFGIDPILNVRKGNPFLLEILKNMPHTRPKEWGQILPTKIFKSNIEKWSEFVTPIEWSDLLYHPKHDGHTNFDKRYDGPKIKWDEKATDEKIETLLTHYRFPLVKNHNFSSDTEKTVLASLIKKNFYKITQKTKNNTTEREFNLYWTPVIINNDWSKHIVPKRIFTVKVPHGYDTAYGSPDPFLSCGYIFAEIVKKDKGIIAVAKLRNDNVLDFKPIIEENFHISYPNVFQYQNYWYMIPETYQSGAIFLYKATNFPYKWGRVKKIYELDGLDSTPFYLNGNWFIFTTSKKTQENYLLTTTGFPFGTWSLVKKGMLKKGYRGGGQPIYKDKMVILPLQPPDGNHGYGYNLELFIISNDLTFTHKSFINPPRDATGIHHLSHDVCSGQYIVDLRQADFKDVHDIRKNPKKYLKGDNEYEEQLLVLKHLPQNAKVLELGGRTGTVSKAINLILDDKSQHLVVEPSQDIDMIKNLENLGKSLGFKVFNGAIGKSSIWYDGYFSEKSGKMNKSKATLIPTNTIDELQTKYGMKFTAIVADCEGCFVQILDDFPNLLEQISHINIEYDMAPETCQILSNKLIKNGFKSVERVAGWNDKDLNMPDGTGFEIWEKDTQY